MVGQFKVALDESKNTETSFREFMIGRFKCFFVLEPVLTDRPSIQSYITTDDIDGKNYAHSSERKDDTDDDIEDKDTDNKYNYDSNTDDNNDDGNDDDDGDTNNNDNNTELSDNDSEVQNLKFGNTAKHPQKLSFPQTDCNIGS